jgi:hypothetical protein
MENNNSPSISSVPVAPKKKYQKKPKEEISVAEVPKVEEVVEIAEVQEKAKRGQSEKTKAALAKGREKLAELNKQRKADREALVNEKINKKAERIAEQKVKMLKELNLDEEDSDGEIVAKPAKQVKTPGPVIKRKAPRVVYVEQEEESEEEEVVYRTRPAPKKKASAPTPGFSGIQFY